ncbi:unnamed protein product [Adineta steineri]|uniref:Uncharacterized protein n=1 Tax=Adineta steineri TaxID=433720 RepID=A0A815EYB2_9BILA|nr:unnamed protein product [Adineta steineri]CAF1316386.1 unnamed protein product [Adineta steineri]CAF1582404.1 unnamed protein product [Adineta steineri]CAF1582500.1 unnamed protein product [Adineta steineri]
MNSSKTIATVISVTALIILFVSPLQSMPIHDKRWTFNTWQLHGPRYTPHTSTNPTTEAYSSTVSTNINPHDQLLNFDFEHNDPLKMLIKFMRVLEMLEREQKEKSNGNKQS